MTEEKDLIKHLTIDLINFSREARRNSEHPDYEGLQRLVPNTAVALLRGLGGEVRIADQGKDVWENELLALRGDYTEGDLFWEDNIGSPEIFFRLKGNDEIWSIGLDGVVDASSRHNWGLILAEGVLSLELNRDGTVRIVSNKSRDPSFTDEMVVERVTDEFQEVAEKVYLSPRRPRQGGR